MYGIADIYTSLNEPVLGIISKSVYKTINLLYKVVDFIEGAQTKSLNYSGKITSFLFQEVAFKNSKDNVVKLTEDSTIIYSDIPIRVFLTEEEQPITVYGPGEVNVYPMANMVYNELQKKYVLTLSLFIRKDLMSCDSDVIEKGVCKIAYWIFSVCLVYYGNDKLQRYFEDMEYTDKALSYYLSFAKYYILSSILDSKIFNKFEDMENTGIDYKDGYIESDIFKIANEAANNEVSYIDAIDMNDVLKVFRLNEEK